MAKNNKLILAAELAKDNLVIGHYDTDIDKLSVTELNKRVLYYATEGYNDVVVKIRGSFYVVEISTVDNEVDFILYSKNDYMSKYGWEHEKEEKFEEY